MNINILKRYFLSKQINLKLTSSSSFSFFHFYCFKNLKRKFSLPNKMFGLERRIHGQTKQGAEKAEPGKGPLFIFLTVIRSIHALIIKYQTNSSHLMWEK